MAPREKLIHEIETKKKRLSYSWLKNFTSPIDFLEYKLKPFTPNEGMILGSVCDVLLLTPEKFNKEFAIVKNAPTTPLQLGFANDLVDVFKEFGFLDDETITDVFKCHYKNGSASKTYNQLKDWVEAKASEKEAISETIYDKAVNITENLKKFDDVNLLLERKVSAQHKLVWEEQGFPMIGFMDFTTPESIFDLKFASQADPENFDRTILKMGYDLQAATYIRGALAVGLYEVTPQYHFLVYDDKGNYFIMEMDYSFIAYGMRKLDYYLHHLQRCIDENAWDQSFNFFKRKYTAHKPKWAKSFLIENDEL